MKVKTVQPPLEFIPPACNTWVVTGAQQLLPLWLSCRQGISHVQANYIARLVEVCQQFQSGKVRFLIAFRHPTLDDPFCLDYLLAHLVPAEANRKNIQLSRPIHAHFLYERGIPLWAGPAVEWLLPRLGATPIQRGKVDLMGLRSARHLFTNGSYPLAVAPEGSLNHQSERLNPLEPGIAQLGFWCVEDLLKAGRSERVVIVPVGIQYHYVRAPWHTLDALLHQMETECCLSDARRWNRKTEGVDENMILTVFSQRLLHLIDQLLSMLEEFYSRFFHQSLLGDGTLDDRLHALANTALHLAEQGFSLQPKGDFLERRHRLEQTGWNRIYRKDIHYPTLLRPVERGLANHVVKQSQFNLWHMHLAETLLAISTQYVREKPSVERLAEVSLLVWQAIAHLKGHRSVNKRPYLGRRWAYMPIGNVISVTERWDEYSIDRRKAVIGLTQDLQRALEDLITPSPTVPQVTSLTGLNLSVTQS